LAARCAGLSKQNLRVEVSMITGGDIIGQVLKQAGATHAFGIPGGEVLALVQGLNASEIRFMLVKHENSGGFFAEGHWHMTGALPVLVATLGPGVANAINVVANAQQDRVPLIFLTGCVEGSLVGSFTHQVVDHQAMLRPVVKGTFRLERGKIAEVLQHAIALALCGQPGPVHIDVPVDVAESAAEEIVVPRHVSSTVTAPALTEIDMARKILAASVRPLAIAGVDAVLEGAGQEISAFCRKHNVPLLTTYKGKGLMPETDALCLGAAGLSPLADKTLMPLIAQADCILLLGYDPIEMRVGWRNPWSEDKRVIEITPVTRDHHMHSVSVTLTGEISPLLQTLSHDQPLRWRAGEPVQARVALKKDFAGPHAWGPHQAFQILRRELPDETIVTADSGAHRILLSQMWDCAAPRSLLQSSGFCTMACALPLAAGAKLGRPNVPVVCVVGDAGLDMAAGELASLRDLKLPVIICVMVDETLALIDLKQRKSQLPSIGVEFGKTDFAAVARAYGGFGANAANAAELKLEIRQALLRDQFTMIAIEIPTHAYDGFI
jgi:acetolactate synthase I/II/III large subunit